MHITQWLRRTWFKQFIVCLILLTNFMFIFAFYLCRFMKLIYISRSFVFGELFCFFICDKIFLHSTLIARWRVITAPRGTASCIDISLDSVSQFGWSNQKMNTSGERKTKFITLFIFSIPNERFLKKINRQSFVTESALHKYHFMCCFYNSVHYN